MSIITGKQAQALVEDMIDSETQTQMCGLELTLQKDRALRLRRCAGL